MNCLNACFPTTLHYESPAHGGWGLVRMAALLPEMHMLFVVPPACGRHGALGSLMNGIKDRVSYLFLTEDEIVSGTYLEKIYPAADELLKFLKPRPKAVFLFGGCIDDLLGTDYAQVVRTLESLHPDVKFRYCHMDPIQLGTANPPGITLFTWMYSLLEDVRQGSSDGKPHTDFLRPDHVNLIGNNVVPAESSDFTKFFSKNGIVLHQLPACHTYRDFEEMAYSGLNIVLSPRCMQAAKRMERKLGIPYIVFLPTYDTESIVTFYRELSSRLGISIPFDEDKGVRQADDSLEAAAAALDGYPVAIDFQAVTKPVTLAMVLERHGFNVRLLAVDGISKFDTPAFEWLKENAPDIEIADPLHHTAPRLEHRKYPQMLCIGTDCAFMTGSKKIVDLQEDGNLMGFDGIKRLSELIVEAFRTERDVMELIKEARLVI